jgi:hypothetical protein
MCRDLLLVLNAARLIPGVRQIIVRRVPASDHAQAADGQ